MKRQFCVNFCGVCDICKAAMADVEALDKIYDSLSEEDRDSLHRRDEDDPRTFALDHKGRP
jgi:hypothetical protein